MHTHNCHRITARALSVAHASAAGDEKDDDDDDGDVVRFKWSVLCKYLGLALICFLSFMWMTEPGFYTAEGARARTQKARCDTPRTRPTR